MRRGADLSICLKSQVYVLSIIPAGALDPVLVAGAAGQACIVNEDHGYRQMLDESVDWLKARGLAAEGYLASGDTVERILEYANKLAVDLIVLGYYPRPSGGFWWSSASRTSLAERARCCILVAVDPTP